MDNISANVHFLWNAASIVPSTGRTTELLRSLYLSRCIYVSQYKLKLPHKHFSSEVRCTNCKTTWKDANYTVKIKRKKNIDKASKRKLRKIIKNKHGEKTQSAVEKAKQKIFNTNLEITCKLCKHVTQVSAKKPAPVDYNLIAAPGSTKETPRLEVKVDDKRERWINEEHNRHEQNMKQSIIGKSFTKSICREAEEKSTPTGTSAKKRKRDKFAGLSAEACLSASKFKNEAPVNLLLKFLRPNAS